MHPERAWVFTLRNFFHQSSSHASSRASRVLGLGSYRGSRSSSTSRDRCARCASITMPGDKTFTSAWDGSDLKLHSFLTELPDDIPNEDACFDTKKYSNLKQTPNGLPLNARHHPLPLPPPRATTTSTCGSSGSGLGVGLRKRADVIYSVCTVRPLSSACIVLLTK